MTPLRAILYFVAAVGFWPALCFVSLLTSKVWQNYQDRIVWRSTRLDLLISRVQNSGPYLAYQDRRLARWEAKRYRIRRRPA